MTSLLLKYFFHTHAAVFLSDINKKIGGPNPMSMLASEVSAIHEVIEWIEKKQPGWSLFLQGITKEQKDRIAAWKRGDNIPSSQYIDLLSGWSKAPSSENINWTCVKALLLIARAIDFTDKNTIGLQLIESTRFFLRSSTITNNILYTNIEIIQEEYANRLSQVLPEFFAIEHELILTKTKSEDDKIKLYSSIQYVRKYLSENNELEATSYWLDWYEARWNVLSGNIEKSCQLYKSAFEGCLYRSGKTQKIIIEEALVVSASLKKPDKVFFKQLKNASITFKYDMPSAIPTSKSFKASNIIEPWEFDLWKAQFKIIFPKIGFFPKTEYEDTPSRVGPIIASDKKGVKPDYRYPDRKITIGDSGKKAMPQIVHFSEIGDIVTVEALILKGASVNVCSDSGDTPILMALRALDVTDGPGKPLDDRLFKLISKYQHNSNIINKRTIKKRLLPLISAVESGRPEIVKKVIEMGADLSHPLIFFINLELLKYIQTFQ